MSTEEQMRTAHAEIGGFLVRCSLLDYRASQFIARWFCSGEKQRYLSYTFQGMRFAEKRQVIEQHLTGWHDAPEDVRTTLAEIEPVLERRELVRNGLLSRRSSGAICIKSFAAISYLRGEEEIDILEIDELPEWSMKASELADRLIELSGKLLQTTD